MRLASVLAPVVLASLLAGAPGCALFGTGRVLRACPDPLLDPREVEPGTRVEGIYRARDPRGDSVLRLVLERRGDTLAVVGLTAIGAPAFQAVQRADRLEVEAPLRYSLAVPPELVIRDLQRLQFPALVGDDPPGVSVSRANGRSQIERPACAHRATWEPAPR